jgi:hypothetical protein
LKDAKSWMPKAGCFLYFEGCQKLDAKSWMLSLH